MGYLYNQIQIVDFLFQALGWLIIARIVLSWFPMDPRHPVIRFIEGVTEPVLAPFRRLIPPVGGPGMRLDLSPIAALLVVELVGRIVHSYLVRALY